jgi:hypothetical protein
MANHVLRAAQFAALTFALGLSPLAAAQQRIVAIQPPQTPSAGTIINFSGHHLNYYGGRVISSVQVAVVFWTNGVNATTQSQIGGFYSTVTSGGYMDMLSEYDTVGLAGFADNLLGSNQLIGHGTTIGPYTITPMVNQTTTVDDNDIIAELEAQIAASNLPFPQLDGAGNVNTLYMVYFPAGYTITLGPYRSCVNFCGYHGTYINSNLSIPYGVLPDLGSGGCQSGCGSGPAVFDNLTSVSSHEMAESITDAEVGIATDYARPLAWYDPPPDNAEIGDLCNHNHATLSGYTVQTEWSNAANACVFSAPARSSSTASLNLDSFVVHTRLHVTASFSVTVAGGGPTPTGQINFFDGSIPMGSATLASGSATFATSQLKGGVHHFQATFMGDTNYLPSTSNIQTFRYRPPISR